MFATNGKELHTGTRTPWQSLRSLVLRLDVPANVIFTGRLAYEGQSGLGFRFLGACKSFNHWTEMAENDPRPCPRTK